MNKGFTLIELLVVVLIIGILSAVALPQYTTAVEKARATEALTLMSAVSEAAQRYNFQKDTWPDSFDKLDVEIPKVPTDSTKYGGKNFVITMSTGTSGSFLITATRSLTGNKSYVLQTTLTEQADGTIKPNRTCTASNGSEGENYCNAITSGHNSSF